MPKTKTKGKIIFLLLASSLIFSPFLWLNKIKIKAEDSGPRLLINEVAPSETRDWIEFYVAKSGDYSGYEIKQQNTRLKTFPSTFYLQEGDFVILHFGQGVSPEEDENNTKNDGDNIWNLYSSYGGIYHTTDNILILYDQTKTIIDAVCYSDYNEKQSQTQRTVFDSIVKANQWIGTLNNDDSSYDSINEKECFDWRQGGGGKSLGRDENFTDTNTKNDWHLYYQQTQGQPNVIETSEPTPPTPTPTTSPTYSDQIIINELYPNPPNDETEEFIELKNIGQETIDLNGWQIQDKSTNYEIKTRDFSSTQISAGGFFVIYRPISGIALNNTGGEAVSLLSPNNETKSSISYSSTAPEGQSFALILSGWNWTTTPTPGQENILTVTATPNQKPKAIAGENKKIYLNEEATFDGSNSYDPDNNPLTYFWDFGDGSSATSAIATHKYTKEGKYTVKLTVEDGRGGTDDDTLSVSVAKKKEEKKTIKKKIDKKEVQKPKGPFSRDIIITEFLPNPKGNDYGEGSKKSGEWIELKNIGKKTVNLSYWQLDDEGGGSRPYTIGDKKIKSGQYLVFYYPQTKINLNNTEDEVRLLDPDEKIVSKVSYQKSKENLSFAQNEKTNKWFWTETLTPGKTNKIQEPQEKTKATSSKSSGAKTTQTTSKNESKSTEELITKTISIADARKQERYTKVKIQGQALVEPKILGSKIFYLQDETAGIQIYFSKEDFPKLILGDLVTVFGKVSEAGGEKKILVANKEDINFLSPGEPPKAQALKTGEVDEIYEGKLIEVKGKVIKKIGLTFYLDDGSGQIRVYLSKTANIKKEGIKKDETVKIKGIVSQTRSGLRLLPRYENDILVGEEEIAAASENNEILSNKKLPSVGNDFLTMMLLALTLTVSIFLPKAVFSTKRV